MKVITICGSMRFEAQMKRLALELECAGGVCVLPCVYNVEGKTLSADEQARVGEAHFKRIELCDAIYVVDVGGYIGESVRAEIAYAQRLGKEILYHSRLINGGKNNGT